MITRTSLPPRARDISPKALPLLRMRNRNGCQQVRLGDRMRKVTRVVDPYTSKPREFVGWLEELESLTCTRDTIIAGMSVVSGASEVSEVVAAIEAFENIVANVQNTKLVAPLDVQSLHAFLAPKIVFDDKNVLANDFRAGLRGLAGNFAGGDEIVGRCTVGGALQILFVLSAAGFEVAGEARGIGKVHSYAYIKARDDRRAALYDIKDSSIKTSDKQTHRFAWYGDAPNRIHESLLKSSGFSFVTSLIVNKIDALFHAGKLEDFLPEEVSALLNLLKCAEAINPFCEKIYVLSGLLNFMLGNERLFTQNYNWSKAVVQLQIGSDGLPILPD